MMKSKILMLCLMLSVLSSASAEELALSRDECRRMALEASEDIHIAENSILQADLDKKVADIARLPKLDGSATALLMLPDIDMMGSTLQNRGTYVAGLQIVQPIYTGGKITAGRNLAKIGQQASDEKLRLTKADVTKQADNFYWTYVAVRSKVEMMDHFIAMMDTLLDQTSTAVEAGMAVGNDLLRIESKRSELLYQREKAINGERMCRMALCNAIGIAHDKEIMPTDTIPASTPTA
ncbi:MAG: TolC family protein, partial [Muribaculaceae bacterium]|nr:TolC family protein [Muribaculaceae bacterium]